MLTWVLTFHSAGVLRLQVDTCAEREVSTFQENDCIEKQLMSRADTGLTFMWRVLGTLAVTQM